MQSIVHASGIGNAGTHPSSISACRKARIARGDHVERPTVPFAGDAVPDALARRDDARARSSRPASRASTRTTLTCMPSSMSIATTRSRRADVADRRRREDVDSRSARRLADRAQGPSARRRPGDHGGLEELARPHLRSHGDGASLRLEAAGMIPLGKTHMVEFAFGGWGRNRPMGAPWNPWDATTAPRRRRLVERLGRRGGRRAVPGRDRLRHRRIDSHSRVALRHHRAEADVRARQPLRRGAALRHARFHRTYRAHRRGLRIADRRDGRRRSARSGDAQLAARRSRIRAGRRARRARRAHQRLRARKRFRRSHRPTSYALIARRSTCCAISARASTKRRSRSTSTR